MDSVFNFPIELWLFQILIILFPTLLYQAYFKRKLKDKFIRNIVLALLCGTSILLCMSFPVTIDKDFMLDFRYVPLLMAFLYGGFEIGLGLSILIVIYRVIIGGIGIYLVLFILFILISIFYFTLNKFNEMEQREKFIYSFGILLWILIFYAFSTQFFDDFNLEKSEMIRWFMFILLNVITMWVTVYLQEGLNSLDQLNIEAMEFEKMHLIGQLSASIALELEKPIKRAHHLLNGLYSNHALPMDAKLKVQESIADLNHSTAIINDYVSFMDSSTSETDVLDVKKELDSITNSIYTFASLHNIEINYLSTLEGNYFVKGNRLKFRQALMNLVKNGIEATQNGSVEIAVHDLLTNILIVIEDNGTGMTNEQLKLLGQPIQSTKKQGTGLGIMTAYRIIGSMKGKLEVVSEQGKGTTFSIILPKDEGSGDLGTT